MKTYLLSFLIILLISPIYGQEIEISGISSKSDYLKYRNSFGYSIGYSRLIKSKSRLGISFSKYINSQDYDDIYTPLFDPSSLIIRKVSPENKRFAIQFHYAWGIINREKSKLWFGPEIGLNYFRINENYKAVENGEFVYSLNWTKNSYNNKLSIGCLLEYQLDGIISDKISTVISIHPELSNLEKFNIDCSSVPSLVAWLNFKVGLRYRLWD